MKNKVLFILFLLIVQWYLISCNSRTTEDNKSIPEDASTIAKGRTSFENKCTSCHTFYLDDIGPKLAGVTSENSVNWIKAFIKDPNKLIQSGDATAQKLLKKYKTVMPSFKDLSDEEVNEIIAYINTKKKEERPPVKIDSNDIKNPIPDSIRTSGLLVDIKEITQVPPSSTHSPLTRITQLDYEPNTNDLFILDLRGKLYKLENREPKLYMDMATLEPNFINQPGLATGFGSFAFHPDFTKNGLLYTTHTESPKLIKADFDYPDSIPVMMQWVVTEWKTDPKKFPFSGTGREIFRINMPTGIHGMQEISFNRHAKPGDKDYGMLYISIGDGGSVESGHPLVSTMPNRIWGTIIRIDPSGRNGRNGKYGIPADNPFANNDRNKYAPEVYAYGFRNPHRFNWTRSGQLLAVNIGQTNIESVNLILPGHFYGWPIREGTFQERFFNDQGKIYPLPPNDSIYHVTYPVAQFDHDEGTAISGGFEYRGNNIPLLKGKYLFGDIGTGKLFFVNVKDLKFGKQATIKKWNIAINGAPTTFEKLCGNKRVEIRFGMDSNGELYITTKADGKVYKLVKAKMVTTK
ncbi:MAG: PQQ-dependent sugar dehydrogenase [Flavisolibacter sp.]